MASSGVSSGNDTDQGNSVLAATNTDCGTSNLGLHIAANNVELCASAVTAKSECSNTPSQGSNYNKYLLTEASSADQLKSAAKALKVSTGGSKQALYTRVVAAVSDALNEAMTSKDVLQLKFAIQHAKDAGIDAGAVAQAEQILKEEESKAKAREVEATVYAEAGGGIKMNPLEGEVGVEVGVSVGSSVSAAVEYERKLGGGVTMDNKVAVEKGVMAKAEAEGGCKGASQDAPQSAVVSWLRPRSILYAISTAATGAAACYLAWPSQNTFVKWMQALPYPVASYILHKVFFHWHNSLAQLKTVAHRLRGKADAELLEELPERGRAEAVCSDRRPLSEAGLACNRDKGREEAKLIEDETFIVPGKRTRRGYDTEHPHEDSEIRRLSEQEEANKRRKKDVCEKYGLQKQVDASTGVHHNDIE